MFFRHKVILFAPLPRQFYHSKAPVVNFPLGENTSAHTLASGVGKSQRNNMDTPPICGYFGISYMTPASTSYSVLSSEKG